MSSLDFPASPVDGQSYSLNGVTYNYNAALGAWLTQSATVPSSLSQNTQVLFNDAGYSGGSYGLVFDKTANTLYAASISVAGSAIPSGNNSNLAFATANAAYAAANNVGPQLAPAFNTANAAFGVANTALANTTGTFVGDLTVTGNIYYKSALTSTPANNNYSIEYEIGRAHV